MERSHFVAFLAVAILAGHSAGRRTFPSSLSGRPQSPQPAQEPSVQLPTVCHKANSIQSPRIGDKDFSCQPDGCNSCSGCSCTENGDLNIRGFCTLVGCDPFFPTCEQYNAQKPFLLNRDSNTFGCYDGCNYCSACKCDSGNNLIPGGTCTYRTC